MKERIRRILNRDREWSLYALADLDDALFPHCDWQLGEDSLALVFRALPIRPIFILGDCRAARALLEELPERVGYLNLKRDQLEAAAGIYAYHERHEMLRMLLDHFEPRDGSAEPLGPADRVPIERLYALDRSAGTAFAPFQLDSGFFRGVRRGGELVAVAGVQVISRHESVAAIGNVLTHPEHRGRGLAQTVTSAVVAALKGGGIETIGLNVERSNAAAIRAYERIGFRSRLHYFEGRAERIAARV